MGDFSNKPIYELDDFPDLSNGYLQEKAQDKDHVFLILMGLTGISYENDDLIYEMPDEVLESLVGKSRSKIKEFYKRWERSYKLNKIINS